MKSIKLFNPITFIMKSHCTQCIKISVLTLSFVMSNVAMCRRYGDNLQCVTLKRCRGISHHHFPGSRLPKQPGNRNSIQIPVPWLFLIWEPSFPSGVTFHSYLPTSWLTTNLYVFSLQNQRSTSALIFKKAEQLLSKTIKLIPLGGCGGSTVKIPDVWRTGACTKTRQQKGKKKKKRLFCGPFR